MDPLWILVGVFFALAVAAFLDCHRVCKQCGRDWGRR
jgi:hypothetical protein